MNEQTYSINISGFTTKEEAQTFLDWYNEDGCNDIDIWLECRTYDGDIYAKYMNLKGPTKWGDSNTPGECPHTLYSRIEITRPDTEEED